MFVTLFDNSANPVIHNQSRGVKLFLDLKHMTARQVASHVHSPPLLSFNEGNFQQLPNFNDFLGWGNLGWFTEYDRRGRLLFDGHFVGGNSNYRAYRFQWTGTPTGPPALAASRRGKGTAVYMSWNGATGVSSWRILGGSSPTSMRPLATVRRRGFETAAVVGSASYVTAQALDSGGRVLGASGTVPIH
jgi:hypothetical protein